MIKLLNLFLNDMETWNLVTSYGQFSPEDLDSRQVANYMTLSTVGSGNVYASMKGKLSINPVGSGILDPEQPVNLEDTASVTEALDNLPDKINLYLHIDPVTANNPLLKSRFATISYIQGFVYVNIETESLLYSLFPEESSGISLRQSLIQTNETDGTIYYPPNDSLSNETLLYSFLKGEIDCSVRAGQRIGQAKKDSSNLRTLSFAVITKDGLFDPVYMYDFLRDFVASQNEVDAFINKFPKSWPVLSDSLSNEEKITNTSFTTYNWAILKNLKTKTNLTQEEWRKIGNNQKEIYRKRLLKRYTNSLTINEGVFEFNDPDWKNLFQLESVCEFFINFPDPFAKNPDGTSVLPQEPTDATRCNFLDPEGESVILRPPNQIQINNTINLSNVRTYYTGNRLEYVDIIELYGASGEVYTYKINEVNGNVITVSGLISRITEIISRWRIVLRPRLVLIDSFGNRISGSQAKIKQGYPNQVILDNRIANTVIVNNHPVTHAFVNLFFDTIYLNSDNTHNNRTYRIQSIVDDFTIQLDGNPSLEGGESIWSIPAGIVGNLPDFNEWNRRINETQEDHYDGLMLIIYKNEVKLRYRWSSYTSFDNNLRQHLSSIKGNTVYDYISIKSPGRNYINFAFKVTDRQSITDGIKNARFYFDQIVTSDNSEPNPPIDGGLGKTDIRIHVGNPAVETINNVSGTASAGCIVSPLFYNLRDEIIDIYLREYFEVHFTENPNDLLELRNPRNLVDSGVERFRGKTHIESRDTLYVSVQASDWNNKMFGEFWLIRPDERPLG